MRLKTLFDAREDLTQKDLGATCGIGTGGMVSQYLNAKRPISLHTAIKFAKGLGVSVADISPTLSAQLPSGELTSHVNPPLHQASSGASAPATLGQTLERLGALLAEVDSGTRDTIANLTFEAICKPDKAPANIAAIEALMRFATGKIETAALKTRQP